MPCFKVQILNVVENWLKWRVLPVLHKTWPGYTKHMSVWSSCIVYVVCTCRMSLPWHPTQCLATTQRLMGRHLSLCQATSKPTSCLPPPMDWSTWLNMGWDPGWLGRRACAAVLALPLSSRSCPPSAASTRFRGRMTSLELSSVTFRLANEILLLTSNINMQVMINQQKNRKK